MIQAKPAVLFLPGLLCDAALFAHQTKSLEADYECHVGDTTVYDTIEQVARSVLAYAPQRFAICALSMGGYVAFEVLRQAPDRVTKLILCNTQANIDSDETKRRRRGLISIATMGQFKGVTPKLLPMLIHPSRLEDRPLTQTIMDMAERVGLEAFLKQQHAILKRIDSRPFLPAIKIPTLIIGGDSDQITPPETSEEMARLIPRSTLHIFETCGHLAPLEYPERTTQLITDFLKK